MLELKQSLRRLLGAPWYFATASAVIALSMALATTVFAVVDDVLFKTLPYERPEELFEVSGGYSEEVLARPGLSAARGSALSLSLRDGNDFAAAVPEAKFAAFTSPRPVSAGTLTDWSPIVATVAQPFFDVLGIQPRFGRFDSGDFDAVEGGTTPVVITDRVWRVRFGGRQDISGHSVSVGERQYRVVGVPSETFVYPATRPGTGLHRATRGRARRPRGSRCTAVQVRCAPATKPTARLLSGTIRRCRACRGARARTRTRRPQRRRRSGRRGEPPTAERAARQVGASALVGPSRDWRGSGPPWLCERVRHPDCASPWAAA